MYRYKLNSMIEHTQTEPTDIADIFQKYRNKIYWLAVSLTRNEKDAEDILQNVFLKIMSNIKNFRHEASLSTWIYRIAYNDSLMYLKKRYRERKFSVSLGGPPGATSSRLFVNWENLPDELLLENELKERINTAIREMPIKYRLVLLLHNTERLPLKDVAQILGLKLNSLKTRLHRAYIRLKEDLVNYEKDKLAEPVTTGAGCDIQMKFIYDYAKGNLAKRRRNAFDTHIKDCLPCKSFLNTYLDAIRITAALECQDIPRELQEKIQSFLSKHH